MEDEAALASMLNKGLKEAGYEVTVAPDGLIGHEMAIKNQFDVMILDIMLPGLNGIQLCKQLRRQQIETLLELAQSGFDGKKQRRTLVRMDESTRYAIREPRM